MKALAAIRARATYATVVAAVTALVVLTGAGAFAASQLAKSSVGTKQLKKNSVTTAKLKKNAVTNAKIKAGAVTAAKVKDGSLTGANLQTSSSGYMRIVHEARGTGSVSLGAAPTVLPLDNPGYTQAADEDDLFYGAVDVAFSAGCEGDRSAVAYILLDSANPTALNANFNEIVAGGALVPEAPGAVSKRINLGPFELNHGRFQSPTATNHTLTMVVYAECETGSGATASNPAVDVIGVR